jgi:hypothetical protein
LLVRTLLRVMGHTSRTNIIQTVDEKTYVHDVLKKYNHRYFDTLLILDGKVVKERIFG